MNPGKKTIAPLIAIFVVFNAAAFVSNRLLAKWGIDHNVLIIANLVFFLVSLVVFFMQKRALDHQNPNVFVRSVMAGTLIKMGVCVAAVIAYRLIAGQNVSKVSVFAAMFLYLVYLGVEVSMLTKLNKRKNA